MQITITALHPAGFPVQIALTAEENEKLHDIVDRLLAVATVHLRRSGSVHRTGCLSVPGARS